MQTVQFVKNLFQPRTDVLEMLAKVPTKDGKSYMDDVFDQMQSNPDPFMN
jgi:hypothetical protein